jgi:hypothetical protein
MKFTAMKHRVLAAQAHCTPAGTVIRIEGGLPKEGPAPASGEAAGAPNAPAGPEVPPAPASDPEAS